MARTEDIDQPTRNRIAAHLREKRFQLKVSRRALAKQAKLDPSTVIKFLNGERVSVGLDVVLKIHRNLHVDANRLLDIDPDDEKWKDPTSDRWDDSPSRGPREAPPSTQPTGRRHAGG